MRTPGWAGRRFTPSFSRRPTGSGSRTSTRPGMSRSMPSTTRLISSVARSTPARRGTRRRCFSRFATDPNSDRKSVTVFADYHAVDVVSQKNARAIKSLADQLPCHGRIDLVRLDPAASARSSLGPAAYSEYEREFGSRIIGRWPQHLVLDGLDTIENSAGNGRSEDPPAVREAEGCVSQLRPSAPGWPVARFSGRRSSRRRHDGRASRRHSRCDARRTCTPAQPAAGPCFGGDLMIELDSPAEPLAGTRAEGRFVVVRSVTRGDRRGHLRGGGIGPPFTATLKRTIWWLRPGRRRTG